jgi:hypothetical protein
VISVEDWAEIRRLHRAEGLPIKEVARQLGLANAEDWVVRAPTAGTQVNSRSLERPSQRWPDALADRSALAQTDREGWNIS